MDRKIFRRQRAERERESGENWMRRNWTRRINEWCSWWCPDTNVMFWYYVKPRHWRRETSIAFRIRGTLPKIQEDSMKDLFEEKFLEQF